MHSLLSTQQRQAFEAQGYLLVRQVLDAQVFDPLRSVAMSAINQYAKSLYDQGQISDLHILNKWQRSPSQIALGWANLFLYDLRAHCRAE